MFKATLLLTFLLAFFSTSMPAQTDSRGSVPPGTAPDGSHPAEGAIQGGSILPGERGGMPENAPTPEQRIAKCNELSGTLRDQCLRDARDAAAGSSARPEIKTPPPSVPPPQNPR